MKKTLSIILAILMVVTMLPMAVMPASAATEATDLPTGDVSYYEGVTQYFKYNNYLYKVTWGNYIFHGTNGTKSVELVRAGNYLACYPNGLALNDYLNKKIGGLKATRCTISDLPKTINTSLNCFNEMSSRHIDKTKPIAVITCVGVNAPTWTWSDDKTSTNAVFVSADGKAQVTIGVTVTSSTVAAENCQEKDKITYTASTTFNGTAYSDVKTEDGAAAGPHIYNKEVATESYFKSAATCDNPAVYYKSCVCGACDKSATFNYGSALGHDEEPTYQDNGDGTHTGTYSCCGATVTAAHNYKSGTPAGTCVCGEECPHEWGEGVLTRPIRITTTDWDDGYYTYTCSLCGHYYQETVKRADYSVLDAILEDFIDAMYDTTLLDSIRNELEVIYFDNIKVLYGDYIESEQAEVDALVETMTQKLAEVEAGVADGSALKPDYTEIDEAIAEIEQKLDDENITYEGKAGLEEIKAQLEEMKADVNTSEADLAELEKALEAYEAELDKGIEDGTLVEVDDIAFIIEYNNECAESLIEKYGEENYNNLMNSTTDEVVAESSAIVEEAMALTGTVAENAEKIAELKERLKALFDAAELCLAGTHSFINYTETSSAKCEENAIETGTCWFCGETDEREVEGTALSHSFTKYEVTQEAKCGVAGKEIAACDNGCGATDEKEIPALKHSFLDYVSNGDATCTADGTKTAECENGCGETDTVTDEGTKLSHVDEDGDGVCDIGGEQIVCPDCGGPAHGDSLGESLVCLIIMFIKLIVSMFA